MILRSLRFRILLAAMLPVVVVVVLIVGFGFSGRVADLDEFAAKRAQLLARQLATASEYGLDSANLKTLESLVSAAQREPDVLTVAIFDAQGKLVVAAGKPAALLFEQSQNSEHVRQQREHGVDTFVEVVEQKIEPHPVMLGHVVLEFSGADLELRKAELLGIAFLIGLAGVALGGVLALQLSRRVVRPVEGVSRAIERIGGGDFSPHVGIDAGEPLHDLQTVLNQMALRLAWGRDELQRRIAIATTELRQKVAEAENATQAKSRFLATASHDLRQPTHAIGMFIARLGQLPMDEAMREVVRNLEASVLVMQDLLDGLLDLSRLEAGAVAVDVRPVHLGAVMQAVAAALRPLAEQKKLRLRVRPSLHWVLTDSMLIQRMLMNLGHNALRYTEQGSVLIAARRANAGKCIRIEVWDSGIGIAPEHQTDIFKEFYQVENSRRARPFGLGLGLNIVERSAQLLGHAVQVRSELGCGTRVSLTVEVAAAADLQASLTQPPAPETALADALVGVKVLVIEDDDFAREALSVLLGAWGCSVMAASSLQEAKSFVSLASPPQVIVSDFRLAEEANGIDAIAAIRALAGRDIPACLMSGDTDGGLMRMAGHAGLTLLHKPVRPAKMRSLLRRLLESATGREKQ